MESPYMSQIIKDWCEIITSGKDECKKEACTAILASIFYHRRRDEWFSCLEPLRALVPVLFEAIKPSQPNTAQWNASSCALVHFWKHFRLFDHSVEFYSVLLTCLYNPSRTMIALYCLEHISLQVLPLKTVNVHRTLREIFTTAIDSTELLQTPQDSRYLIGWIRNVNSACMYDITVQYQDELLILFTKIYKILISQPRDEYYNFQMDSFVHLLYAFLERLPKLRSKECHKFLDFCVDRVYEYFSVDQDFESDNNFAESSSCVNYSEFLCTTIALMTSSQRDDFLTSDRCLRLHSMMMDAMKEEHRIGLRDFAYRLAECLVQFQLLDRVILSDQLKADYSFLEQFISEELLPCLVIDIPKSFKLCTDESTVHRCVLLTSLNALGGVLIRYGFSDVDIGRKFRQRYLDGLLKSLIKICRYNEHAIRIDAGDVNGLAHDLTFDAGILLVSRLGMVYPDETSRLMWQSVVREGNHCEDTVGMRICSASIDNGADYLRGLLSLCEAICASEPMHGIDLSKAYPASLLSAISAGAHYTNNTLNKKAKSWRKVKLYLSVMAAGMRNE
ncbi:hypothetical protein AKO1_009594 [Acrasis kona]|uniref:Uncharacterized protein n=1 Tax=Acrasis kona TaxID=1008807 RepID=A0AAW2YP77_9EUKA